MASSSDLVRAISEAIDPSGIMQRITERTLELIGPAQGVMVGLAEGTGVTYVAGAGNQSPLVGTHVDVTSSLSGRAMQAGRVLRSDDTEVDDRVDREACRRHSVRALVCVPLLHGGEAVGVLAVNAPEPGVFTADHVATLTRLGTFVGTAIASAQSLFRVSGELLSAGLSDDSEVAEHGDVARSDGAAQYVMGVLTPEALPRLRARERIQAVLDEPELLSVVFQPIIDLVTDETVAVEALARFDVAPYRSPDIWFTEAHACDLGVELELLALERALALVPLVDDHLSVNVNVGPLTARTSGFLSLLDGAPKDRIILELTEHEAVDDYPELIGSLQVLRRNGVRIAIDDTGSGYSSLSHILKIAPDYIKLDGELTTGIDLDPVRRALAASLVAFADETGSEIVAEGVETADELAVFRRLGVRFAQGFHLGRPAPLRTRRAIRRRMPPI